MTILQVLRSLAYGGVETYVVKLSTGLAARGHRVFTASNGGPLVAELERGGTRWCRVHTSGLGFLWAQYELARLIRREGVDVVNAHHGSVGIAACLAARSTGVPFLLSIHAIRPAWQKPLVANWPPKVLAVSKDSRDYIVQQMGLSSARVIESFIGVDVGRFLPGPSSPALQAGLGLSRETPVILHVSRFSREKSKVGIALAEAAPSLTAAIPELVLLLVGTGHFEHEVRVAAARANARIGRQAVRLLGPRSDIPELMRLAALVVGTGSVALEAMASGCPVVAAGKYGFVGPVTPANFALVSASCFGDHTAPAPVTAKALGEAILPLLLDEDLRRESGCWGREKVVESYRLEKMVDQLEGIYAGMAAHGV